MDNTTHKFMNSSYYGLIKDNLSEYNTKYSCFRLDKVVMHVDIKEQGVYKLNKASDSMMEGVTAIREGYKPYRYLWHYNYDGNPGAVLCDESTIDNNQFKYVKNFNSLHGKRHRITWYMKPKKWVFPKDDKFEGVTWSGLMTDQDSKSTMAYFKTVCFGPVIFLFSIIIIFNKD